MSYRSPQEIALRNAAEELGVTLGAYYPDDADSGESPSHPSAERLDASREELLVYIDRLASNRRRTRRRARTAGVVVAAVGLVTVGLSVASPWGTHPERPRATRAELLERLPPSKRGAGALGTGGTSVTVRLRDGRETILSSAFVDRFGDVCLAILREARGVTEKRAGGGCKSPASLAAEVLGEHAVAKSVARGKDHILLQGYARSDIKAIVMSGSDPGMTVAFSQPWAPRLGSGARGPTVRAFLVRIPVSGYVDILEVPYEYELLAVFPGGKVVRVGGLLDRSRRSGDRRLIDPVAR